MKGPRQLATDVVSGKYLKLYAEPEARLPLKLPVTYSHVLVLPALDESVDFVWELEQSLRTTTSLLILVVNATDATGTREHERNQQLMATLLARAREVRELATCPPVHWLRLGALDVVLVDRASQGFRLPVGEGVGLARRIGADMALALRTAGSIASKGFGSSDADARLPADYFAAAEHGLAGAVAAVFPFRHIASDDSEVSQATSAYELWLRYYVLGLERARSVYAYHSLGSTLYVDFKAYADARGFPKRLAGEDYYLLSKLAKLGRVRRLHTTAIDLQSRCSLRVPFGTGPGVARLLSDTRRGQELRLMAPRSFLVLREVLLGFDAYAECPRFELLQQRLASLPEGPSVCEYLDSLGWHRALSKAATQANGPRQLRRRLRIWFDALRTLRLLHHLRDSCLPLVTWQEALRVSALLPDEETDLNTALRELRERESHLSELVGVE